MDRAGGGGGEGSGGSGGSGGSEGSEGSEGSPKGFSMSLTIKSLFETLPPVTALTACYRPTHHALITDSQLSHTQFPLPG